MTEKYTELYQDIYDHGSRVPLDAYLDSKGATPGAGNLQVNLASLLGDDFEKVEKEAEAVIVRDYLEAGIPEESIPEHGSWRRTLERYVRERTNNEVLLERAAMLGDVDIIKELLPYANAQVNESIALRQAFKGGHLEAAETLLPFSNTHTPVWEGCRSWGDEKFLNPGQWEVLDAMETKMRLQAHVPQAREYLDPPSLAKHPTEGQGTPAPERKRGLRL